MLLFQWDELVQLTRHLGNEPATYTSAHRPISRTISGGCKRQDLFPAFWVESKSPVKGTRAPSNFGEAGWFTRKGEKRHRQFLCLQLGWGVDWGLLPPLTRLRHVCILVFPLRTRLQQNRTEVFRWTGTQFRLRIPESELIWTEVICHRALQLLRHRDVTCHSSLHLSVWSAFSLVCVLSFECFHNTAHFMSWGCILGFSRGRVNSHSIC